jgi:type IV secretory pathway TrbD component
MVTMLREIASLGAAGLVFGQTVSDRPFSWLLVALGIATWLVFASLAVWLAGVEP